MSAIGPYTPIVRSGGLLVTSGQLGLRDGELVEGFEAQFRQALDNLGALLASEGASFDDVIKATVFLTNGDDWGRMNDIYVEYFTGTKPARSAIGVASLPRGAVVEIEAWAAAPDRD